MDKEQGGVWRTINGTPVFIKDGQSIEDAFKSRQNYDANKEKQISQNKKQAAKLNNDGGKTVNSKQFNKDITNARSSRPIQDKWRVDIHTAQEYDDKGCKCWTSSGGSTVAVTNEGDIISVCKYNGDRSIHGSDLLANAVKMGGTKLDSFSGNHKFYTDCGFEPVSWTPFNKQYAPDGWKEAGAEPEPVIFYKYVGVGKVKNLDAKAWMRTVKPYDGDSGYDDAYAFRDSTIKK